MNKYILSALLLAGLTLHAQNFQWQWAKTGGGIRQAANEGGAYFFDSEQVIDIAVDQDNNYYYLTFMTEQSTMYDGLPVTVYNSIPQATGNTDVVLISTDCSGNLRWTQTIGGGVGDFAYKIELDNAGGLYIGANVVNLSHFGPEYQPPHFTPTDAQEVLNSDVTLIQEGCKMAALLKYNTADGSLAWRVMPQGPVNLLNRNASIQQVQVSTDGTVHTLIGFAGGTHLNGAITVPATFTNLLDYYIVKYNANGNQLAVIPLELEGYLWECNTDFRYDENLQRYYIAGYRTNGDIFSPAPLKLNGIDFQEQAYIAAFSSTGAELWRREMTSTDVLKDNRLVNLEVDSNSDLYLAGKYFINYGTNSVVKMGSYTLPNIVEGNVPYVLKMDINGNVQWVNTPISYTNSVNMFTGLHMFYDMAINGNEIVLAGQVTNESWGNVSVTRPDNHLSDPALLRLNKNTGAAIAVHDIMTSPGFRDGFSAVAVDNQGNYIAGGYFFYDIFTSSNDNLPTIIKANSGPTTDFFMAKFAPGPCSTASVNEVSENLVNVYPNPAKDFISIESDAAFTAYEIRSITGQLLAKSTLKEGQRTISLESFSTGMYILNLIGDSGTISKKIIKE